jgi:hypothetical protein
MSLKGVDITRGALGASVLDNADAVCGLLLNGTAVSADQASGLLGIAVGQTVRMHGVKEAAAYGITEEYDATNSLSVYRHVSEFFRTAGEGSTLYLMLYTGLMPAAFGNTYARKMIADSNGEIRCLAVGHTPATAPGSFVDGLEENMRASISVAQAFYEWSYGTFRPCQVILEGYWFNATGSAAALDLRNITVSGQPLSAYKVSVCIAQDYGYADGLDAIRKKFADIGTMLGTLARKAVNENIGEVQGGSLVDTRSGRWLTAGLSNHMPVAEMDGELEGLDAKGYIFAVGYAGIAGYFWNNDHTATPVIKDADGYFNEYTVSYGRTHDKAVRNLRTALLPMVKSTQPVDSATGKLPQALVAYFESVGNDVLDAMRAAGEISAGKTTVDADSDLLISPRILKVSFVIVPTGQIDGIRGVINLKTGI